MAERAAIAGLRRAGDVSCGGATRLLPTAEGWLAVTLSSPDDLDLVPAWLGLAEPPDDAWAAIRHAARTRPTQELVDRAVLLGLPIAVLPQPVT